jgi:hypothetical protein
MGLLHKIHKASPQAVTVRIFECNISETTEQISIKFGIRGLQRKGNSILILLQLQKFVLYWDLGICVCYNVTTFRSNPLPPSSEYKKAQNGSN